MSATEPGGTQPDRPTCSGPECDRPVHARGLCSGHHRRWLRIGQVGGPLRPEGGPGSRPGRSAAMAAARAARLARWSEQVADLERLHGGVDYHLLAAATGMSPRRAAEVLAAVRKTRPVRSAREARRERQDAVVRRLLAEGHTDGPTIGAAVGVSRSRAYHLINRVTGMGRTR